MATIEEIERREAEMRAAEATALRNLAAHLREAVMDLPAESQLARAFVRRARTFEDAACQYSLALHGDGELWMLRQDVDHGAPEHPIEAAKRALLAAAEIEDRDDWVAFLRRMAASLPNRESV